jgi:predicted O-methyltransferase YrrM
MKRIQELPPAEFTKRIDEFLLAVGPATGQLMNLLIKEAKARNILELGTSHGYSTVWLAEGQPARPAARSSRWMSTPANSNMPATH